MNGAGGVHVHHGASTPPADRSNAGVANNDSPYVVHVSLKFILLGLFSTALLAFSVGRAARIILLEGPRRALFAPHDHSSLRNRPDYHEAYATRSSLPPPIARKGRPIPKTVYTAKNFDTARTATSASLLLQRNEDKDEDNEAAFYPLFDACEEREDGSKQCSRGQKPADYPIDEEQEEDDDPSSQKESTTGDEEEDEEEHLPAGQHLLVDMKGVDGAFLNSEKRLADAMVEVVNEASLTLLSYHCHKLLPAGVSCVGVLLESHVSFHTWPTEGVITLDLYTCGSNPLVPVMPIIEHLFGIPRIHAKTGEPDTVETKWWHKLRGFRPKRSNPLQSYDLGVSILGSAEVEMKNTIASIQTEYQQIDIVDVIVPRFNRISKYLSSLAGDQSYESLHPEYYEPDRIVFLDGVIQSRKQGQAAFHESLVHPGMFAHDNPKRVAVIGGGEGATLREVLKHKTVEEAVMIDIDEVMVRTSKEHLPDWSDCSDLLGSADWCGDDPRARIYYEDALGWFMSRYGGEADTEEPFDVIIMDSLDPETEAPFALALYDDLDFVEALYNALSEDGILVVQLGTAAEISDPAETYSRTKHRARFFALLEEAGFESVHAYEESHCGFFHAWSYVAAFKSYETRATWYANEAEIQVAVQQRAMHTKSGRHPFRYFDGPSMASYQMPSKPTQVVYCRRDPTPEECTSTEAQFDVNIPNAPTSSFEVKVSNFENAGRGLFAKIDIAEGSYIGAEESVHHVHFMPSMLALMEELDEAFDEKSDILSLTAYGHSYGFGHMVFGKPAIAVDSGIHTFVNHGCNASYNSGIRSNVTETTAHPEKPPEELFVGGLAPTIYSPFVDRHIVYYSGGLDHALRDIQAGEEILTNYLHFVGNQAEWENDLGELRRSCGGGGGSLRDYEHYFSEVGGDEDVDEEQ